MIAVLMGVTGTGKTVVAHALVKRTGWQFAEGDDYHSDANKAKMHAGIPLTDEDRAPWLATLHGVLAGWLGAGQNGVMTCSALKARYRDALHAGLPEGAIRFVLLEAPKQVLVDRLSRRIGHFMNPVLLDSQLATLELTDDLIHVSATATPEGVAEEIVSKLGVAQKT